MSDEKKPVSPGVNPSTSKTAPNFSGSPTTSKENLLVPDASPTPSTALPHFSGSPTTSKENLTLGTSPISGSVPHLSGSPTTSKENLTLGTNPISRSVPHLSGSPTTSKDHLLEEKHESLLPEILVTKETEELESNKIPTSPEELLTQDRVSSRFPPSVTFSPPVSSPSPIFSSTPVSLTSDKQLKSSIRTTPSFLSSRSDEESYQEKWKNITRVISGLSFPTGSLETENVSTSSGYGISPRAITAGELESRLVEMEKSLSAHCATQTVWGEEEFDDIHLEDIEELIRHTDELDDEVWRNKSQKLLLDILKVQSPPPQSHLTDDEESGSSNEASDDASSPLLQDEPGSPSRTYQNVFKCILQELLRREEEADISIDLYQAARLKRETRKKLAQMLKINFERYKDVFKQILKTRDNPVTATYNVSEYRETSNVKEYHINPSLEVSPIQSVQDLADIDEGWTKSTTKAHKGAGVPMFYKAPRGKTAPITNPLSYPSGYVALVIIKMEMPDKYTYMIFENQRRLLMRALINNRGHATFFNENEDIWVCMTFNLGFYFYGKGQQKAWNWWNTRHHVHAPPNQPIRLSINSCCKVHIKTQDKVFISFKYYDHKTHLNLGTKVKVKDYDRELQLKNKAILETHKLQRRFLQINALLKKMEGILKSLRQQDLENFINGYSSPMTLVEERLRKGEFSILFGKPPISSREEVS